MPTIDSLDKLFEHELKDIYDAEKRLTKALPKMAKAAVSSELRSAIAEHLAVTKNQVGRLGRVFDLIGKKAVGKPCAAIKGLLEESDEAMAAEGPEPYTDIGMIFAARRVEHYEIAAYISLRALAGHISQRDVIPLIEDNLREEHEADVALAALGAQLMEKANGAAVESHDDSPRARRPTAKGPLTRESLWLAENPLNLAL